MQTKFFTNSGENTLINKFKGVFTYHPNIKCFDALVGYFRASGYFRIREFLDQVPKIRILVGIDVDKLIAEAHSEGLEFFKNHEKTKEEFITGLKGDIETANYKRDEEGGILQFIDDIIQRKIEIKAHPDKRIHAKVYILRPEPFNEHTPATAITGSSNLTDAGLGGGNNINYEFNVQLSDYDDVKFASDEFEKLWSEAVDILPVDIQNVKKLTYLNDEVTPFELYIKLLIEYFGSNIDYDPDSIGDLPPNFKKLSYQVDAVNEGYNMLIKDNGFFLADVVGLGKTIIAAMVAKKFISKNGRDYTKVLIVYPPAVEKNWKNTFKDFQIDKYTKFISNGSLDKIINKDPDYWNKEEYDLVIVDEAHKFRNHTTGVFEKLQLICKSPRKNRGNIEGTQKKVILVSATPLNNKPDDIYYQLQMFQDSRKSSLPVTNLTSFFAPLMEQYKVLKRSDEIDIEKLRAIYNIIRERVIKPITIRRTRTDLERISEYKNDLIEQGIIFPQVLPPEKIEYEMDTHLNKVFYKTVFYLTDKDKIYYSRYQAIAGLKPEIQNKYYENAELVSKSLAGIMKNQLVKRLESSFFAFKKSLKNFLTATNRMIDMFTADNGKGKIFIAPDADINKLIEIGWSESQIEKEIERLSENNPKNQTFQAKDFEPDFLKHLIKDAELLTELVKEWETIEIDPKLTVFLKKLKSSFLDKRKNIDQKLVIFSESKDTIEYLSNELIRGGRKDVLVISSENRKQMQETIVANFDANCPENKQENKYNIIMTTEVLAEGVNLHRSNVIVHYDTPWNSTRLMQRIGRVNRIGTKANKIYNYVFYPSAQGNEEIKLKQTAFMKLQAFHTAFGEDNQVFSVDEVLDEVKLFNDAAVKEEQDERLVYLYFLRNFKKTNKAWFDTIKRMPLKSRTGRSSANINCPELKNGTAAFLKTRKKCEFYWINAENQATEITDIEAFKLFEADKKEKRTELIPQHHDQVNIAIEHFEVVEQKIEQSQIDPSAAGGVAKRAKSFLSEMVKHPMATKQQKENISKIILLIDIGKFTNLPSEIDRLRKKKQNLKLNLSEIDTIADKYDIETDESKKEKPVKLEKPNLIISESFE